MLFFNCGGLSELQAFLDVEELQELVIGVFEFLALLENNSKVESTKDQETDTSQCQTSEESNSAVKTFLTLLRFTANVNTPSQADSPGTDKQEICTKHGQVGDSLPDNNVPPLDNLSLRFHVWKACLNLLVSNKVFMDSFTADEGPRYSYELFHWLIEHFKGNVKTTNQDVSTVAVFEVVLAVCIRISYAGLTKGCVVSTIFYVILMNVNANKSRAFEPF